MATLKIEHRAQPGHTVLSAAGEIDLANVEQFETALAAVPRETPLIMDLSAVEFMGSSGIQRVTRRFREAVAEGTPFVLVPSPVVERLIELLALDGVVPTCPTLDAALAALHDPSTTASRPTT